MDQGLNGEQYWRCPDITHKGKFREVSGLFYNLGRKVEIKVQKANWFWQSIADTDADAIKVEHEVGRDLAS